MTVERRASPSREPASSPVISKSDSSPKEEFYECDSDNDDAAPGQVSGPSSRGTSASAKSNRDDKKETGNVHEDEDVPEEEEEIDEEDFNGQSSPNNENSSSFEADVPIVSESNRILTKSRNPLSAASRSLEVQGKGQGAKSDVRAKASVLKLSQVPFGVANSLDFIIFL